MSFAVIASPLPVRSADASAHREYAIKAAALFNFVPFIHWPVESFPADDTPVVIGILGPDPFGPVIDRIVAHETLRGHPIRIERYASLHAIGRCHILFIARGARDTWRKHATSLAHRPILTVSDTEGFARGGGMVQFYTDRNRLRMIINLGAARAAGLNVSSKLLRLADVIKEDPSP